MVLLLALVASDGSSCSATELARQTGIAYPTASKVLKLLLEAGLVRSLRGASGGYALEVAPDSLTLLDVIKAVDGVPALTQCSGEPGDCDLQSVCGLSGNWQLLNKLVQDVLSSVPLTAMSTPLSLRDVTASLAERYSIVHRVEKIQ